MSKRYDGFTEQAHCNANCGWYARCFEDTIISCCPECGSKSYQTIGRRVYEERTVRFLFFFTRTVWKYVGFEPKEGKTNG